MKKACNPNAAENWLAEVEAMEERHLPLVESFPAPPLIKGLRLQSL